MQLESSEELLVERRGALRVVTLNRPAARNAFTDDMHERFGRLLADIDTDPGARAMVLTGAGSAFCAGGSLADFEAKRVDFGYRRASLRQARRLVDEMINLRVPLVAAVNGPAVGLGCTLVTLSDIVFIAETAYLSDPHVSVALVAGDGGAVSWPLDTSLHVAKQYLLTGDRIPAAEAKTLGLANFVLPPEQLMAAAIEFAERLAARPPQAVQETKAILNQHLRQSALVTLGYGLAAESQSHDTSEFRAVSQRETDAG